MSSLVIAVKQVGNITYGNIAYLGFEKIFILEEPYLATQSLN